VVGAPRTVVVLPEQPGVVPANVMDNDDSGSSTSPGRVVSCATLIALAVVATSSSGARSPEPPLASPASSRYAPTSAPSALPGDGLMPSLLWPVLAGPQERSLSGRCGAWSGDRHRRTPTPSVTLRAAPRCVPETASADESYASWSDSLIYFAPRPAPRATANVRSTCAPGRIRTCDRWIRSPLLYPAELRAHHVI
jgi:hypothetical protein